MFVVLYGLFVAVQGLIFDVRYFAGAPRALFNMNTDLKAHKLDLQRSSRIRLVYMLIWYIDIYYILQSADSLRVLIR